MANIEANIAYATAILLSLVQALDSCPSTEYVAWYIADVT
jgi:hypothetical protein